MPPSRGAPAAPQPCQAPQVLPRWWAVFTSVSLITCRTSISCVSASAFWEMLIPSLPEFCVLGVLVLRGLGQGRALPPRGFLLTPPPGGPSGRRVLSFSGLGLATSSVGVRLAWEILAPPDVRRPFSRPPARPRLHLWVLPFGRSPFALLPGLGCALGGGPAVNLLTPKPLSWRLVCTSLLLVSLADARRSGLCLVPSSSSLPCVSPSADAGSLAPSLRLWASAATLLLPLQRAHRLRTSLLRVRLRSRWPGFSRLSVGGNKYITACTVWRVTVLKVAPFSCCKTGLRALCARRPSGGGLSSVLIL